MAKTNFKEIYKSNGTEYAYTTTDHSPTKTGQTIPLYVPSMMPNINSASPKISTIVTKGSTIFKNSGACKPKAQRIVKNQNYITPQMSRNQNWDGLTKTIGEGEDAEEYVPRKTRVMCTSATNNTKNMNFTTDFTK